MNFMCSLVQFIARCFVLFAVLAIVPLRLSAQDATGRVIGFVYDQSGAVISGAHILVTNVATLYRCIGQVVLGRLSPKAWG